MLIVITVIVEIKIKVTLGLFKCMSTIILGAVSYRLVTLLFELDSFESTLLYSLKIVIDSFDSFLGLL